MRRSGSRWWAVAALLILGGVTPGAAQSSDRDRLEAEIKLTVGTAFLNNDSQAEALSKFEEAIQLDPQNGTAHFLAATTLNRMKRYQDALDSLQLARQHKAAVPPGRIDWFEGEAHYWMSDYAAAESAFRASLDADPADAYAHFYLGLSLLSLGDGSGAVDHFDRAVKLDAELAGNSAFYAGKGYFADGELEQAKVEFEKALSSTQTSENTRKASTNYLSAVQTVAPPGPPKGELRAGYAAEADSNVVLEPDLGFPPGGTEEISDSSDFRNALSLRGAYYPFYDKAGWSMGLILNAYQSIHSDLSQFDLTAPQGIVSFTWGRDPQGWVNGPINYSRLPVGSTRAVVMLQAAYDFFQLDGENYLATLELGGAVKIAEGNFTSTQLDIDYRDNDFDTFEARSGTYAQFRVLQNIYIGGRREQTLQVGLRGAVNDADQVDVVDPSKGGMSDDYDYDEMEFFANFALTLPSRVALFFQASLQNSSYDNPNSNVSVDGPDPGDLRDDDRLILSSSVAWSFSKHWALTGRYTYYQNDSNKDLFEYDRSVASLGITWYY